MKKGFTLIEIQIVISVIAVIQAIAIPNLLRARLAANESSAISSLRTMVSSQAMFYQGDIDQDEPYDYRDTWPCLYADDLIDNVLDEGLGKGYLYVMLRYSEVSWVIRGVPSSPLGGDKIFTAEMTGSIFSGTCGNGILEPFEECEYAEPGAPCPNNGTCDGCCRCWNSLPDEYEEQSLPQNIFVAPHSTIMAKRSAALTQLENLGLNLIADLLDLAPGETTEPAIELLKSKSFLRNVLKSLDTGHDKTLSFEEMTSADLLGLARELAKNMKNDGPVLNGYDEKLKLTMALYQQALRNAIEPGMTPDETLPLIPLEELESNSRAKALLERFPFSSALNDQ